MYVISLSNISIETNFKQMTSTRVEINHTLCNAKNLLLDKVAGKKSRRAISNLTMSSASQTQALPVM
jgi:hypothetical protein